MTEEEKIICKSFLHDADNTRSCNEYKLLMELLEQEPTTKNDLESYKDVDGNSLDDLILEVLQNNFDCGNTYGYKVADEIIGLLPSVTPQKPKTGYLSIDDAMSVFDDFMCGEVDEEDAETFLEMLKDKAESEVEE